MPALGAGSFNGLNFGPATKIHVGGIVGFDELPDITPVDVMRGQDPGLYSQSDVPGGRTLTVTFHLIGDTPSDYDSLVASFKLAMVPNATFLPLNLFGLTRTVYARVRRRSLPYEVNHLQRTGTAVVEFKAADPRVYEGTTTTVQTVAGAALPQALTVTNAGTYETRGPGDGTAAITVTGPLSSGWILQNTTDGSRRLTVNYAMTAGDTTLIDLDLKTITHAGANARGSLGGGSLWFKLLPGSNALTLSGAGGGPATQLAVASRGAFL